MVALTKVIGIGCCGLLVSLALCTLAQTEIFGQEAGEKQMYQMESGLSAAGEIIQGEVLRIEGNDCVLKGQDGKEVRLQIDRTTLKARNIEPGDRIEAIVNDQNQVLTFRPAVSDRRNDKE